MEDRSFGWTVEMSLKAFQALLTMDTPKLVLVEVPLRGKKRTQIAAACATCHPLFTPPTAQVNLNVKLRKTKLNS